MAKYVGDKPEDYMNRPRSILIRGKISERLRDTKAETAAREKEFPTNSKQKPVLGEKSRPSTLFKTDKGPVIVAPARKKSAVSSQKKSGLHKGHKDDYTLALGKGEKRLKSVIDEGKFRP